MGNVLAPNLDSIYSVTLNTALNTAVREGILVTKSLFPFYRREKIQPVEVYQGISYNR